MVYSAGQKYRWLMFLVERLYRLQPERPKSSDRVSQFNTPDFSLISKSLQIRGRRIYSADSSLTKKRGYPKTRPNTAEPATAGSTGFSSRYTPTTARDELKFVEDVRGRRVIMSPRTTRLCGDNASLVPHRGRHTPRAFERTQMGGEEDEGKNTSGRNSADSNPEDVNEEFGTLFEEGSDDSTSSQELGTTHGNCIERQGHGTLLSDTPIRAKSGERQGEVVSVCKTNPVSVNPSKTPCYQIRPPIPRPKIHTSVQTVEDTLVKLNRGTNKEVSLEEYRRRRSQAAVKLHKARRIGDMTYKEKYARVQNDTSSPKARAATPRDKTENTSEKMSDRYRDDI